MADDDRTRPEETRDGEEAKRKPYSTPRLVVHGTIADITGLVGKAAGDAPLGSSPLI